MRIVILTHGLFTRVEGKTAKGVYLYSPHDIVAIIDRTLAGHYASEFFPRGRRVKIVGSLKEVEDYDALVIGAAPIGGKLPRTWREEIKYALTNGKTVISGLHDFLSEDEEFRYLAEKSHARIWDLRKPPENMRVADGSGRYANTVLIAGTDCSVGKMITTVELTMEARRRGMNAGFIATGQTGMLAGCDSGAVIDRIPGDFMSGVLEDMVKRTAKKREIVFVEGQGALSHPAYSGVALAILHGSYAKRIVIAHDPTREHHYRYPDFSIPSLEREIELYEKLSEDVSGGRVVAISIDGENMNDDEISRYIERVERELNLPADDVLRHGAAKILDSVLR